MGKTSKSATNTIQGGKLDCLKLTNEFILKSCVHNTYVWIYMCICVHVCISMHKYIEVLGSSYSMFILSMKTTLTFVYLS